MTQEHKIGRLKSYLELMEKVFVKSILPICVCYFYELFSLALQVHKINLKRKRKKEAPKNEQVFGVPGIYAGSLTHW